MAADVIPFNWKHESWSNNSEVHSIQIDNLYVIASNFVSEIRSAKFSKYFTKRSLQRSVDMSKMAQSCWNLAYLIST